MREQQLRQDLADQRAEQRALIGLVPEGITKKFTPTFNVPDLSGIADPVMVEKVLRDAADAVASADDGAVRRGIHGRREWLARRAAAELVLNKVAHVGEGDGLDAARGALEAFDGPAGREPKLDEHNDALVRFIAFAAAADAAAEQVGEP